MNDLIKKLKKISLKSDTYKNLPETPGVYIFFKNEIPVYVGKAINLKRRVSSYFDIDLEVKNGKMVTGANYLSYIRVIRT
jgi:excinuclease ABC subunit C